ncbi:MAG TPA: hypothetical protein VLU24_02500 [Mycobacterium sp.]|nr:hypothetical protein [Mycobacterium sp.]
MSYSKAPSLQVPPAAGGVEQAPVSGSQLPAMWQLSIAPHCTGFEPTQVPDWQPSAWVQTLPSLQDVPFGAAGFEQAPVDGEQAPARWHWSDAVQTVGLEPVQMPD